MHDVVPIKLHLEPKKWDITLVRAF